MVGEKLAVDAHGHAPRRADFQSAVTQTCSLLGLQKREPAGGQHCRLQIGDTAD
jgi:hypothetical protein